MTTKPEEESKNALPKDGDPRKLEPSMLWTIYTETPTPHVLVPMPVNESFKSKDALDEIAMVPISVEERMLTQMEAYDYAVKYLRKLGLPPPKKDEHNPSFDSVYDMDCTIRVLWRSCRVPGKLAQHTFPAPNDIRARLTPDQVSILALHYVRVERLLSPIEILASEEELDNFIERLVMGGEKFPLDYLPSDGLRDLVWRLACRLGKSPSPSNSPGSPPADTPPASAAPSEEPPAETAPETETTAAAAPPDREPGLVRGSVMNNDKLVEAHLKATGHHHPPKK